MEKDLSHIRRAVENMHHLLETLVALQKENNQCCRVVVLPQPKSVAQPIAQPESEPEILFNRNEAAEFLRVHPRTVTRYRLSGRLRVVHSDGNQLRYRQGDLSDCYFWKWGKRP